MRFTPVPGGLFGVPTGAGVVVFPTGMFTWRAVATAGDACRAPTGDALVALTGDVIVAPTGDVIGAPTGDVIVAPTGDWGASLMGTANVS